MRASRALCLSLLIQLLVSPAHADRFAAQARRIVNEHADATVTIRLILHEKLSFAEFATSDWEAASEATGTVIDERGLIVTSLSLTDPTRLFEGLFDAFDDDDFSFRMDTDIAGITIITGDGDEFPGRVVLRDEDLDLVYILPEDAPDGAMPHVTLTDGKRPEQFDRLVALRRLGRVANRGITADFPRVRAVMEKPVPYLVLGQDDVSSIGQPVFDRRGRFLGIVGLRMIKSGQASGFGLFTDMPSNVSAVVVSVEDIFLGAEQVPEAGE